MYDPHITPTAWGVVAVLRVVLSKCSMQKLAPKGLTRDPLAAPYTCS